MQYISGPRNQALNIGRKNVLSKFRLLPVQTLTCTAGSLDNAQKVMKRILCNKNLIDFLGVHRFCVSCFASYCRNKVATHLERIYIHHLFCREL